MKWFAGLLLVLIACGPSAEAAYSAALLRCVDKSQTLDESKACRALVDSQYGVDGGKR